MSEDSVKEKKTKKKNQYSFVWILGIVILILISLTFVLPTTMFGGTQSAISFGKYDGKSIELTANSFFYYQLQSLYSYYVQYYGESTAANYSYSIYYNAYQQALLNEAFQVMAEKAGFNATNEQIYSAIIDSNYYSDGTNGFSEEVYSSATDMQKEQIIAWMKEYVPFQEVQNTIMSVPVSGAESDFVKSLSDDRRTIEYAVLDSSLYPDEDAKSYAEERADLFSCISFIRASYSTEDEALEVLSQIESGTKTIEEAAQESASLGGGSVQNYFRYQMNNESEDVAASIYSAEEGTLIGPAETSIGYSIYKITESAHKADYTDENVLNSIKSYIATADSDVIKSYLDSIIDSIYLDFASDYDNALVKYNLSSNEVSNVALNTGDSQFIYSFSYTEENASYTGASTNGYIYSKAEEDKTWIENLFSLDYSTVVEPFYINGAYIIARPLESTQNDSYTSTLLKNMYSSYAPQFSLVDYESKVLTSDKVEDNFISAYIQALYGTSSN